MALIDRKGDLQKKSDKPCIFEKYERNDKVHGWVTKEHAKSILKACKKHGICVTIRDTGTDSIKRIKEGHPCKGHDILHKSLKKGSIDTIKISNQRKKTQETVEKKGCEGLVGYWENTSTLAPLGIPKGVLATGGVNPVTGQPKLMGGKIVKFTDYAAEYPPTVYTGDYDMHDLLYARGGGGIKPGQAVVSESKEEKRFINGLNFQIWEDDKEKRLPIVKKVTRSYKTLKNSWEHAYALFRHGAQRNFIAFALDKKEAMIMMLVKYDPPIAAFCHDGSCYILYTLSEIKEWYSKYSAKEPEWWNHPAHLTWEKFGVSLAILWKHRKDGSKKDHSTGKPFTKDKIEEAAHLLLAWRDVTIEGKDKKGHELYTGDLQKALENVGKNHLGGGIGQDPGYPKGKPSKEAKDKIKVNLKSLRKNKKAL